MSICSTAIPLPVLRGMKLLAPSIDRVCKVVLSALDEENRASMHADVDMDGTALGVLKKRGASYCEEMQSLQGALSVQDNVYQGMFKCGDQAVAARKRARKDLKKAIETKQKPRVITELKANEDKCYENICQFVEWCRIAKAAKDTLQKRYEEEERALADVDNDIRKLEVLQNSSTPTADTRSSDVQAFMVFLSTT